MGLEIQGSSVAARGDGWLSAWVGSEFVMMSADTGTCISLSETGGRIWELMEEPQSVDQLCQRLMDEYQADLPTVQSDVYTFLESLRDEQAVVIR